MTLTSENSPIFIIIAFDRPGDTTRSLHAKILASSLLRTSFTGSIAIFRNTDKPLYSIDRNQLEEFEVPGVTAENLIEQIEQENDFVTRVPDFIKFSDRQWVIFADPVSVAMRNIDHLFENDYRGLYPPPRKDFQGIRLGASGSSKFDNRIWSIRGQYIREFMLLIKQSERSGDRSYRNRFYYACKNLKANKFLFEKHELHISDLKLDNFSKCFESAFVSINPLESKWEIEFIQAMYLGRFFADSSGLVINILDA